MNVKSQNKLVVKRQLITGCANMLTLNGKKWLNQPEIIFYREKS
jgi:hypothetical protein